MEAKELIVSNSFDEYDNKEESFDDIKNLLPFFSSVSKFDDTNWYFNLRAKSKNIVKNKLTVYFRNIPLKYILIVKYFVLLMARDSISNAIDIPTKLRKLFTFCVQNNLSLKDFELKHFQLFEGYIEDMRNDKTKEKFHYDTKYKIWTYSKRFLSTFNNHADIAYLEQLKTRSCPLLINKNKKDKRLPISNDTLIKLDDFFDKEDLLLHFKTAYWLIRLYPFRVNEYLNLKIDCLKLINDDYVMLTIPNMKGNGGYSTPINETELLYIKEENQNNLVKLIKLLQSQSISIQHKLDEKMSGMLFTYIGYDNIPHLLSSDYFNIYLKKVIKKLDIKESITIHQFRTTGTTLRAEYGFTSVQLKELLKVNLETIDTYSKPRSEHLIKKQKEKLGEDKKDKIYFKGRIINGENIFIEKKIISNPLSHKLPDMGFCSFENKCGKHYECLDCKYLIPDFDLFEYYREMALSQLSKAEYWEKKRNMIYYKDSLHRATLFTKLYEKILKEREHYVK